MEELKKKKHNHKFTDILKVSIFSIVMLAPFIAVGVKCLYVLNPNANQSYYGKTINEEQYTKVDTTKTLNQNKTYRFYAAKGGTYTTNNNITIYCQNFVDTTGTLNLARECKNFLYYANNGVLQFQFRDSTNTLITTASSDTKTISFNFQYISQEGQMTNANAYQFIYNIEYNKQSYLDNVFYYAVEEMQNENLFSWAKNTGIYTTIETMTTGLEMNDTIAMLLAYWSICTAVYIVFDIIIFCIVKITHFMND